MKYPAALLRRGRSQLPREQIQEFNYLYTRHKPSTDWNEKDGLPDFTRIKLNQSFNWCIFSIPIWTRFNDKKEYKSDYAIAAFKVKTIRECYKYNDKIKYKVLDVDHKPTDYNYSHCEMKFIGNLNKTQRREIRMTLRHECFVPIKPYEELSKIKIIIDIIKMHFQRMISLKS